MARPTRPSGRPGSQRKNPTSPRDNSWYLKRTLANDPNPIPGVDVADNHVDPYVLPAELSRLVEDYQQLGQLCRLDALGEFNWERETETLPKDALGRVKEFFDSIPKSMCAAVVRSDAIATANIHYLLLDDARMLRAIDAKSLGQLTQRAVDGRLLEALELAYRPLDGNLAATDRSVQMQHRSERIIDLIKTDPTNTRVAMSCNRMLNYAFMMASIGAVYPEMTVTFIKLRDEGMFGRLPGQVAPSKSGTTLRPASGLITNAARSIRDNSNGTVDIANTRAAIRAIFNAGSVSQRDIQTALNGEPAFAFAIDQVIPQTLSNDEIDSFPTATLRALRRSAIRQCVITSTRTLARASLHRVDPDGAGASELTAEDIDDLQFVISYDSPEMLRYLHENPIPRFALGTAILRSDAVAILTDGQSTDAQAVVNFAVSMADPIIRGVPIADVVPRGALALAGSLTADILSASSTSSTVGAPSSSASPSTIGTC